MTQHQRMLLLWNAHYLKLSGLCSGEDAAYCTCLLNDFAQHSEFYY